MTKVVSDEERWDRIVDAMVVDAEMTSRGEQRWWWLSFTDSDRPKGKQFLGVAIVQGASIAGAVSAAWRNGCNPGGEIAGFDYPDGIPVPREHLRNRLLSKAELKAAGLADV